jgi:hypothetical protein
MTEADYGKKLPVCIRKYERGNIECDGRSRARDPHEKASCFFRDRCAALRHLVKLRRYKARDLVKLKKVRDKDNKRRTYAFSVSDSDEFQRWLLRAVDKYGIRNGRVTIRHPKEEKAPKKIVSKTRRKRSDASKEASTKGLAVARKAAVKAIKKKSVRNLDATLETVEWFLSRLQRSTGIPVAKDRSSAKEGQMYTVDRVGVSRYIAICVMGKRRSIPLVRVMLSIRTHLVWFKLPLTPDEFSGCVPNSLESKLGIEPCGEGRFKSKTTIVDREGCSIVAKAIADAVDCGLLNLSRTKGSV